MDCKCESVVKTVVRIELIILQGVLYGIVLVAIAVSTCAAWPVLMPLTKWRSLRRLGFWRKVLRIPIWIWQGICFGLVSPFVVAARQAGDIMAVAKSEWTNRWATGQPKKPDGHPLPIKSIEEREILDAAVTLGVIADYNEEAKEHGQGVDFPAIT